MNHVDERKNGPSSFSYNMQFELRGESDLFRLNFQLLFSNIFVDTDCKLHAPVIIPIYLSIIPITMFLG